MKKSILGIFALIALISFNQVSAQTSSLYILSASTREYITPFAGFGVDMTPDTCAGYAGVANDVSKITYLLTTQIKDMMTMYNNASCNTETTPSTTCTGYIDTINNLTLTYATYQVEGLKQAKEKTRICNTDNTRKPNVYKKTYYGIDIVALTYASVRDAYVNKKFTNYATLLNNVNTNLVSKLNKAVTADKFVDATPSSANLRTLAQSTFKTTNKVIAARSRTVPQAPSTTLSMPNAFLFFGQTNNVSDKTIGAIPMNSLQEFADMFNVNPTRFGDIYSATNRPLLDAGDAILMNINRQIDLRLPNLTLPAGDYPATTTPLIVQQPPTQKASVINSIGNWFGGVWGAISDFFGYMFWGERAGAKATAKQAVASGTGASGSGEVTYPETCPGLKGPRPAPSLIAPLQIDENNLEALLIPSETGFLRNRGIFHNLFVLNSDEEIVAWNSKYIPSGSIPVLSPEEKTWLVRSRYLLDNKKNSTTTPEVPEKSPDDIQRKARESALKHIGKSSVFSDSKLSEPTNPYNCLRDFEFFFAVDWKMEVDEKDSRDLGIEFGRGDMIPYAFSSVKITVDALNFNQTANIIYNSKVERSLDVLSGKSLEKEYSGLRLKNFNKSNDRL